MIYYIITAVVTAVIVGHISSKYWIWVSAKMIADSVNSTDPLMINDKQYFLMTKDQIQKAARAINSLEAEYNEQMSEDLEIN
jgi:hypothetical protein